MKKVSPNADLKFLLFDSAHDRDFAASLNEEARTRPSPHLLSTRSYKLGEDL